MRYETTRCVRRRARQSGALVLVLGVLAAGALGSALPAQQPDEQPDAPSQTRPSFHDAYYITSGDMMVLVPGNWTWHERASGTRDPAGTTRTLTILPSTPGELRLSRFTSDRAPELDLERAIERRLEGAELLTRAPVGSWGPFEGAGALVRFRSAAGVTYRMIVVAAVDDDGRTTVVEQVADDDARDVLDPGFTFIEKTLTIE